MIGRPNLIGRAVLLGAAALAILALVLIAKGGSSYDLQLRMPNASGLRAGSEVLLGGVQVGSVNSVEMSDGNLGDTVIADLHLNPAQVKIGHGVHASIIAANLLGEKYVALSPGDVADPLESGTTLPGSATTLPTDLDEVVDVLDGATRARLAILLNEAGIAADGREKDVSAIIGQIPPSLTAATRLLNTVVEDNHTLSDAVSNSDQFITRIDAVGNPLTQFLNHSAGAAHALAVNADALRTAIIGAPQALIEVRRDVAVGTMALTALTPVAHEITVAAPRLDAVLRSVKPFTDTAMPTLDKAASVAPTLTQLAQHATPTITQAVPTVSSLSNIAHLAAPLSTWAGLSSVDLINIFGDWAGAIQNRDAAGHMFSGNVFLDPAIVLSTANVGATPAQRRQNLLDIKSLSILRTLGLVKARAAARAALGGVGRILTHPTSPIRAPKLHLPKVSVPKVSVPAGGSGVPKGPLSSLVGAGSVTAGLGSTVSGLLGGLLGGHGHSGSAPGTGAPGHTGTTGGTGSQPGAALKGLLGYLLGK